MIIMKVRIYSTKSCPECRVLKSYLLALDIDFYEEIVESPEQIEALEQKTGQRRVPVLENGDGFIIGFDPEKVKALVH